MNNIFAFVAVSAIFLFLATMELIAPNPIGNIYYRLFLCVVLAGLSFIGIHYQFKRIKER